VPQGTSGKKPRLVVTVQVALPIVQHAKIQHTAHPASAITSQPHPPHNNRYALHVMLPNVKLAKMPLSVKPVTQATPTNPPITPARLTQPQL